SRGRAAPRQARARLRRRARRRQGDLQCACFHPLGSLAMETKTKLAEKFAQLYFAEVDPEELAARDPADLQGAAAAHRAFGRSFSGGEAKLRASNPVRGEHGWASTHTVIEIVSDDMPFLVDTVTMEANRQGLTLHLLVHPVLRVLRDAKGELRF